MSKPARSLFFLMIVMSFPSCEKDPLLVDYNRGGELEVILDRGNIEHVGANNHSCQFTKEGSGFGIYTIWNGDLKFLNSLNSHFGEVSEIQSYNDSIVLVANSGNGLGYFIHEKYFPIKFSESITQFDHTGGLILVEHGSIRFRIPKNYWVQVNRFFPQKTLTDIASYDDRAYIGTSDGGLFRYNKIGFEGQFTADETELLDNDIKDLMVHQQDLWILTNLGLTHKYGENDLQTYPLPGGVYGKNFTASKGEIFINTSNGLYIFDDGEIQPYRWINDQLEDLDGINITASDPKGNLWLGTKNGLYRFKPSI